MKDKIIKGWVPARQAALKEWRKSGKTVYYADKGKHTYVITVTPDKYPHQQPFTFF